MSNLSRARITRGDINLTDFRALGELPCYRMLPRPAPDDEYLNRLPPTVTLLEARLISLLLAQLGKLAHVFRTGKRLACTMQSSNLCP